MAETWADAAQIRMTVCALNLRTANREFERQHILKVLSSPDNNKVAAARPL